MKNIKKLLAVFGASMVIHLYTAFVVMNLWNWFSRSFHFDAISYWETYGLMILISVFTSDAGDIKNKPEWEGVMTMLEACVPAEKMEEVRAEIQEQADSIWADVLGVNIGIVVGNTFALALGFAVHVLNSLS